MPIDPIKIIEKYYDSESRTRHILIEHGKAVAKKALELAETKADCETFNQNTYPLYVVLEVANFVVK